MPVTIKQIAQQAKVSHGAVSAVLNDRQNTIRVSQQTRERILRIAEQMGYRRNSLAAGLRGGKTRSIGLVWPFEDDAAGDATIGMQILRGLQAQDYATIHADHLSNIQQVIQSIDDMAARRVDALVIHSFARFLRTPEIVKRLNRIENVLVVCQQVIPELTNVDQLIHDRVPGIQQVAEYLYASGCKKPGIALCMHEPDNHLKYHAFRDRWLELGGQDHEHLLLDLGLTNRPRDEKIWGSFDRIFKNGCDVDAIFCINDMNALFAGHYIKHQLKLRIPDDVALVGMNNMEAGLIAEPPLATISRNREKLTEVAQKMLVDRMADPAMPPRCESVPMQFVWRESAGPNVTD
ncbi:MAG: LacI family DNA-binding transcriptional regulator [Phycisphaeraceae bacterium JB051]